MAKKDRRKPISNAYAVKSDDGKTESWAPTENCQLKKRPLKPDYIIRFPNHKKETGEVQTNPV